MGWTFEGLIQTRAAHTALEDSPSNGTQGANTVVKDEPLADVSCSVGLECLVCSAHASHGCC